MNPRRHRLVLMGMVLGLLASVVGAVFLVMGGSGAAFAQRACPQGERWDQDDVVTLEGKVTEVERPFATLESGGKTYTVHLGPLWFWQERGYTLARGDAVTITGEVSAEGKAHHLYPYSLRRGDSTYRFADDDGVPLWSGGRGRGWGGRGAGPDCWHHARCGHGTHGHGPCDAPCCGGACCGK